MNPFVQTLKATTIPEIQNSLHSVLSLAVKRGLCNAELATLVASQWYEIDGSMNLPATIMDAQDVLVKLIVHFGGLINSVEFSGYEVIWADSLEKAQEFKVWVDERAHLARYADSLANFVAGVR